MNDDGSLGCFGYVICFFLVAGAYGLVYRYFGFLTFLSVVLIVIILGLFVDCFDDLSRKTPGHCVLCRQDRAMGGHGNFKELGDLKSSKYIVGSGLMENDAYLNTYELLRDCTYYFCTACISKRAFGFFVLLTVPLLGFLALKIAYPLTWETFLTDGSIDGGSLLSDNTKGYFQMYVVGMFVYATLTAFLTYFARGWLRRESLAETEANR